MRKGNIPFQGKGVMNISFDVGKSVVSHLYAQYISFYIYGIGGMVFIKVDLDKGAVFFIQFSPLMDIQQNFHYLGGRKIPWVVGYQPFPGQCILQITHGLLPLYTKWIGCWT
jgi:hypothetical protein